jgi:hypothetical protein
MGHLKGHTEVLEVKGTLRTAVMLGTQSKGAQFVFQKHSAAAQTHALYA